MKKNHSEDALFTEFPPVPTSDWENKIHADLKGADYTKKLIWNTEEGFSVKPYYRAEDLNGLEYINRLKEQNPYLFNTGRPGAWMVRQDIHTADISLANHCALEATGRGADAIGFNVAEVSTHKQMKALLNGIDFEKTAVYFITSKSYPLTLELFIYEINHRGLSGESIRGGINFDPISYLLLNGDFYITFNNNLEEAEYLLNTVRKRLPLFRAIAVNGHYFQDSGSSLVQELAFSLAAGNEYYSALTEKGFSADILGPRMLFHFACGPNYFMEIAKLRAARLLWARIAEQYNPGKSESLQMFIHSSTSIWNKTVYDPYVNMLRTTTEGMSAAIGFTDSLSILPFDLAFKAPDDFSNRIARNQQLIFREEASLDKTQDPSSGSYYLENLTDSIADNAWKLFLEVEEMGGMIEAVKSGFIQDEVEKKFRQKKEELAQRKRILIGTNQFPELQELMLDRLEVTDGSPVGPGSPYKKLVPARISVSFESLRFATEAYVLKGNKRPGVFLLPFGNLAMQRARASFATNFFGCAGYEIFDNPCFEDPDNSLTAIREKRAEIVVFCSSDEEYAALIPKVVPALKKAIPELIIVVAGYPKDQVEAFTIMGVDEFIHIRSNLPESLGKFNRRIGIPPR